MKLSLIAALSENRVIGKNNQLPWHLPEDLKLFKQLTMGKPIIMGRQTFESIGRPLPGRLNLILSRQTSHYLHNLEEKYSNILVFQSLEALFNNALFSDSSIDPEVFVIGGSQVYKACLPWVHRLYLSRIPGYYEGDSFFPNLNWEEWSLIKSEPNLGFVFEIWEKKGGNFCEQV
ncbi:MAG: dihydrofolate reductase [Gammaproteobacteria bacterium]